MIPRTLEPKKLEELLEEGTEGRQKVFQVEVQDEKALVPTQGPSPMMNNFKPNQGATFLNKGAKSRNYNVLDVNKIHLISYVLFVR